MRKPRKNYSPEEKLAILKRHLVEGTPVSDLCDEVQLNPNVFYGWQKQLFENGVSAFERPRKVGPDPRDQRIEQLEDKLRQKNEVLAELMQEHVEFYNHVRLHSAIGYVAPADKLFGLENIIHSERDRKLEAAREERVMAKYLKPDLLIIDDMGMKQLPKRSGEYLFEIIMRRYETRSTMMTSNRPLEDWGKLIGDIPSATAILDRFLHHAEIITITGRSYRLRNQGRPEEEPKDNGQASKEGKRSRREPTEPPKL